MGTSPRRGGSTPAEQVDSLADGAGDEADDSGSNTGPPSGI
jgi:hypothetical protein